MAVRLDFSPRAEVLVNIAKANTSIFHPRESQYEIFHTLLEFVFFVPFWDFLISTELACSFYIEEPLRHFRFVLIAGSHDHIVFKCLQLS